MRGVDYYDATLIFGLSRAGYIPELISFSITTPEAVYDMAQRAESKILIYDSLMEDAIFLTPSPIPTHIYEPKKHQEALQIYLSTEARDVEIPNLSELTSNPDAVVYILHTSGSTSGRPKLVPWTYQWVDNNIEKMLVNALLLPDQVDKSNRKQFSSTWVYAISPHTHLALLVLTLSGPSVERCVTLVKCLVRYMIIPRIHSKLTSSL